METNQWRSKKKIESSLEKLQRSSIRSRGQARMVPPGAGIRSEKARKSLNEKLETVALNSPKQDKIFLKNEEMSLDNTLRNGDSSLLGRDQETKKPEESVEDDDLVEMKSKIQALAMENSQLKKHVVSLEEIKSQMESEFKVLLTRLEEENAFLRYEYTVLEKDLEVKTEYTRRSMELTHKQQLRNVNKIVELEAESQRLRLLFRKKFPQKSIMIRNEDEERKMEMKIKSDLMMKDEVQNRKLKYDLLMEQIGNVRTENKNLMDIIMKKNMEIKDLSSGKNLLEMAKSENSVISPSGSKEMKLLMDDFNEMEKLAIVYTEKDESLDWSQVVLSAIMKQKKISNRGFTELLQDIRIGLGCLDEDKQELRDKLEEKIRNLEAEIKALKESKETLEVEIETEKSMKEDSDTKLNITRVKLNETQKKLSCLEVELDYRKSFCEQLEGTCIELQLQLESVEMKQVRTETSKRSTLRDKIEESKAKDSSFYKEEDGNNRVSDDVDNGNHYNALIVYEPVKMKGKKMEMNPRKKQGLGFLKKLMFRTRVSSKKCIALTM